MNKQSRKHGRSGGDDGAELQNVEALVPVFRLPKLKETLARLALIAKRAKQPFSYEVGEPNESVVMSYHDPDYEDVRKVKVAAAKVTVRGIMVPRTRGWRMVAALEGVTLPGSASENLVYQVDQRFPVDPKYRKLVGVCDHCKKSRQRLMTFVLRNEDSGAEKMVGRNCLADFLNDTSADLLVENAATLSELLQAESAKASDEEMEGYGRSRANDYAIDRVLFYAAYLARTSGFISAKRAEQLSADEGRPIMSTAMLIGFIIGPLEGVRSDLKQTAREVYEAFTNKTSDTHQKTVEMVEKTKAFFATLPRGVSDYTDNVKMLLQKSFVISRHLGLVVSSVGYYMAEERKRAVSSSSAGYLGEVGKDLYLPAVKLIFHKANETRYGTSYLNILETPEGNKLVWFSSSKNLENRKGQTFSILGTVKAHQKDERTGALETVLTRAVVDAAPPPPPKEPKRSAESRAATAAKKAEKAHDKYVGALRKVIADAGRGLYATNWTGLVVPASPNLDSSYMDAREGDYSVLHSPKMRTLSGLQNLVAAGLGGGALKMTKPEVAAFEAYMSAQLKDYVSVKRPYEVTFKALEAWSEGRPASVADRLTRTEKREMAEEVEAAKMLMEGIDATRADGTFPALIKGDDSLVQLWMAVNFLNRGYVIVHGTKPYSDHARLKSRKIFYDYLKSPMRHYGPMDYEPEPVRWGALTEWMHRTLARGSAHGRLRRRS